ncbi:MAG: 50S ribosomal protein L23 [Bacteriovoracaceae bacterium]
MHVEEVIVKPLITEKTSLQSETDNRYGFVVQLKANKNQIKNAVESLYDVKVLNVKTSVLPGKLKRAGTRIRKTGKTKRALIQIAEGQKIEFFKGI